MGFSTLAIISTLLVSVTPEASKEAVRLARQSALEYDLGHAEEALRLIEKAYLLDPRPGLLFNLGQCHRKLGHWADAESAFRAYLRKKPGAPNRGVVAQLILEMHERVLREHDAKRFSTGEAAAPAEPFVPAAHEDVAPPPLPPPAPARTAPATRIAATPPPSHLDPIDAVWAQKKPPPPRSHTAAYVLGGVALAGLGFAIAGIAEIMSFESLQGQLRNPASYTQYQQTKSQVLGQASSAQTWEAVAVASGIVFLGAGTAAGFTW